MQKVRYPILAILIIIVLSACSFEDLGRDASQDQIATNVAQTLDALNVSEDTPEAGEAPTSPVPTATADTLVDQAQTIVIVNGENIWTFQRGSGLQQLTFDGRVDRAQISTDGKRIAFTRRSELFPNTELFAINPDGTGEMQLLSREDLNELYPSPAGTGVFNVGQFMFRPNTHDLFFNTAEVFELGYLKTDDLFMVNSLSGEFRYILPASAGGDFLFSPDGSKIAIMRPDSFSVIDGDGANYIPEILTFTPVLTYSEFQYYPQPVWSQDSSIIGVALPSDDPLAPDAFGEVWYLPADGESPFSAGKIEGDFYFTQVFSNPALSPNLDRIAYSRPSEARNSRQLFISSADGIDETLVDVGEKEWHGWAPDSSHFVYRADDPTAFILALDGGESVVDLSGVDLYWIDEGHYLIISGEQENWDVSLGELYGASELISTLSGDHIAVDWSD
jgi:Tol biopolymer transport system component